MSDVVRFGLITGLVAAAAMVAVLSNRVSERLRVPAPAIFLVLSAVASDVVPGLASLSVDTVQRVVTLALIPILFDGGMHIGWRRFRSAAGAVVWIGIVGTLVTAAAVAVLAHLVFGFGWLTAMLLGTALAPTDPAVVFSVLGRREVTGRSGTILEGESGANDPVGIALMASLITAGGIGVGAAGRIAGEFVLQMGVGAAVGLVGGRALLWFMRAVPLPSEGLYPLRTAFSALILFGAASLAHGSGFLAVFVAGLLIGDERAPYKAEIERFHTSLAAIAEVVAFVALGLTVDLTDLGTEHLWLDGLALALLLTLAARPLVTWALLVPTRLRARERLFVVWGGLKGAVPILLAALAILDGVAQAHRIYGIVFVVVAFSVVVQGTTIPLAARLLGIPMRVVEPEPWDLSIRLRREPQGVQRFVVARGARAEGEAIRDLPLGEHSWVSLIVRGDEPRQARGSYVFEAGDEVLLLSDSEDTAALRRLFEGGRA
jgi:cell volume regulation protein A